MNTIRFFTAALFGTLLLISCKNDTDNKDNADVITMEEVNASKQPAPVKTAKPLSETQRKAANNLQRKLMKTKDVNEFTRALVTAELINELSNLDNDYTVLGVHNDAFKDLAPGQNVLSDPSRRAELVELLSNHILKGSISSADLAQEIKKNSKYVLTTIHDKKLTATMKNDVIVISTSDANSTVTLGKTDIKATNGMLHVVDQFLK